MQLCKMTTMMLDMQLDILCWIGDIICQLCMVVNFMACRTLRLNSSGLLMLIEYSFAF